MRNIKKSQINIFKNFCLMNKELQEVIKALPLKDRVKIVALNHY